MMNVCSSQTNIVLKLNLFFMKCYSSTEFGERERWGEEGDSIPPFGYRTLREGLDTDITDIVDTTSCLLRYHENRTKFVTYSLFSS